MDLNKVKADVTLDLRGVPCPIPPIKTVRTLGKMNSGEILEVVGYNPMAKRSAPWIAQRLGNQMVKAFEDDAGVYRVFYKKA